jgi:hypothetical protein
LKALFVLACLILRALAEASAGCASGVDQPTAFTDLAATRRAFPAWWETTAVEELDHIRIRAQDWDNDQRR